MPTNRRMRSTLDHHSTAGPTLLGLDASNLSMGRTPTLDAYQVHSSADGAKPSLESNHDPISAVGIPPLGSSTLLLRFPTLGGPNRHSVIGLTVWSRHI